MTTCSQCGTEYGGRRTEHCTGCHETFVGQRAGDWHRVGTHGVDRHCLTPGEMEAKGMKQHNGRWTTGREMPLIARASALESTHSPTPLPELGPDTSGPQIATQGLTEMFGLDPHDLDEAARGGTYELTAARNADVAAAIMAEVTQGRG